METSQPNCAPSKNESIFERCHHDRENPYAQISRELIQDRSISPKAKGVLIYILSLPKDWQIFHSQLQHGLNIGEDYLNSAMEELITAGYADRTREKLKGIFQPYRYKIREFKKCSPDRENRPGSTGPENPAVQKTHPSSKEIEIVCKREDPPLENSGIQEEEKQPSRLNGALVYRHVITPPKGEPIEMLKEEIYRRSIGEYAKHQWTNAEIAEAWESLINSKAPIISPWRYLEKTIEGIRMALKKKQQAQYCKRNSIKTNNIEDNIQCQQAKDTSQIDSMKKSESSNENYAEKSTSGLLSPSSFKPIQLQGESRLGYHLRQTSSSGQESLEPEKPTSNHV